jgi:isoamylase
MINLGSPWPLGLSSNGSWINFALHAPTAHSVTLVFFKNAKTEKEFFLDPSSHKTGEVWHVSLQFDDIKDLDYLYLIDKTHWILDPYAKFLNTSHTWSSGAFPKETKACVKVPEPFEWDNVAPPNLEMKDLIIYEMHVRSFTVSLPCSYAGTFRALIDKIPYLKSLGINAVELMPIHEFNECEHKIRGLYNVWGYSPLAYFALMNRYASGSCDVIEEFKTLVKNLHQAGIACIIDVVYNHTAEGGTTGPVYNFKKILPHFYIKDSTGHFIDYTGCGNTINANSPEAKHLILESLRYLAIECQVDGFRFDLASTFFRDEVGICQKSKMVEAILQDPVLSKKLLIAEAWDASGLYQVGHYPNPFADWNGAYRDKVRSFMRGDPHTKGAFADAISGSCGLYYQKSPEKSINFITAHDGFTLHDLFSYNEKHNMANGESNKDGSNQNISCNFGHEGPSNDQKIIALRKQMIRAAYAILYLSLGTPMILMGDEYGHTRAGNNNAWCHDNELNHFDWKRVDPQMTSYLAHLTKLRSSIKRLTTNKFYTKDEVSWHGPSLDDPKWELNDQFLALFIHDQAFFIFNLSYEKKQVVIPKGKWCVCLDSSTIEQNKIEAVSHVMCPSHSVMVLLKN